MPASPASLTSAQASIPNWIWDGNQRGPYAGALASGPCQTLINGGVAAATAHQNSTAAAGGNHYDLELADARLCSAIDAAAQAAPLQRKRPWTGRQPPHLSCYPWRNPRCLMLQSQLRQAKLLSPRSPHIRLPERQYQSHLRHSRDHFAQRGVLEFSQQLLFKSNPRKFWQTVRLPSVLLPKELQTPAAWDAFLNKLISPPTQHATQLPAPHTAQPPVPAHSLNQPLTFAEVEVGLQQLHHGRSGALHGYTSEFRAAALCQTGAHSRSPSTSSLNYWRLALSCYSTQLSAQGRCLNRGRLPWSLPSSRRGTPQTQPTTGQSQLASPSAGSMPALWYSA